MLLQGLMLTVIGMGTVFLFLLLLILLMHNLESLVGWFSKICPIPEEQETAAAPAPDMQRLAAAVFIATRLCKQGA